MSQKQRKKEAPKIESFDIEKFLIEKCKDSLSISLIQAISKEIEKNYQKKIRVEILETMRYSVRFLCNLSPAEMKEREKETRLLLPETSAGDDYHYHIIIDKPLFGDPNTLPKLLSKSGLWEYQGFV